MWILDTEEVAPRACRFRIRADRSPLSFRDLFDLLEHDAAFGAWYTKVLADCTYPAFFWEHPPLSISSFDREAEFVLTESAALRGVQPDPTPFASHFGHLGRSAQTEVVVFPNLGGDAQLVVPCPLGPFEAYADLARFVRLAPRSQVHALWRQASYVVTRTLGATPQWLSTAGLGVSWLHLRVDTRPKYYRYKPYQKPM